MYISVRFQSRARRFGLAVLLLLATLCQDSLRAREGSNQWTAAENCVLTNVQAGGGCDLGACAPADQRRISADFLAKLLTGRPEAWHDKTNFPPVVSIGHATIYSNIDLANREVPFEVELTNCVFEGEVMFSKTVFRRSLRLSGSQFQVRSAFSALVVGRSDWSGSLYLDSAAFNGGFDLTDATIERNLFATNAKFRGEAESPRFGKMTVKGDAWFEDAAFTSAPMFTQAEVKHGFFATRAHFNDSHNPTMFDDLTVGDDASFASCLFLGPVDFTDASIKGDFLGADAHFQNTGSGVNFTSLKVDGSMLMPKAYFCGPVDFTRAAIGGGLDLASAVFSLASGTNLFHEIKVGGDAVFDAATFASPVLFHAARIADELSLCATCFNGRPDSVLFDHMVVSGPSRLARASFSGEVSFEHSTFSTLILDDVNWPTTLQNHWLHLDGFKYDRISDGTIEDSRDRLIKMLGYAAYNANAYADLESYYQRTGHPDFADKIFFAQKYRERTDKSLHASFGTRAWSNFLNVFVRYGRAPGLAFLWGVAIVLLGTFAFNEKCMEPQPKEESDTPAKGHEGTSPRERLTQPAQALPQERPAPDHSAPAQKHPLPGYSAFWYSLDLFAPVIDLEAAKAWRPRRPDHGLLYHYSRLHRILGWVLVPIGAAAVTGLAK